MAEDKQIRIEDFDIFDKSMPAEKAGVLKKDKAAQASYLTPEFVVEDRVSIAIWKNGKWMKATFLVKAREYRSNKWYYQLKDNKGNAYGEGEGSWIAEAELNFA